jgi:hypothetical protein
MKKTVLMVLCLMFPIINLWACGCDMLITYQGIMPADNKASVGLNLRQRYFKGAASTHNHSDGSAHEHGQMNQLMSSYELNYRFFMTQKLMLTGNLQIADNQLSSSQLATNNRNTGIADPVILLKYEIISPKNNQETITKHRLLIGSGVKLPFGKPYKDIINNIPSNENLLQLQLGTGSFDWIVNTNYQLKIKNVGLQTDVLYKKNFAGNTGFLKGNQLNLQTNFFYQKRWSNAMFMPYIGATFENAATDKINSNKLVNTGGSNLYANIGSEIFINKLSIYFNYQQLINQQLNGFQMKNNLRFTLGINYNLNFNN